MNNQVKKINKKMMVLSCIGIVLVVFGHIGSPITLAKSLFPYYSFHMALFIFISGYFYKTSNEDNIFGKNGYILNKAKKLVIPYFIWNLVYGIILILLRKYTIISFGMQFNLKSFFVMPWINGHQYILNIPAWFLLSLFLVNIIYVLQRKIFKKVWNDYIALLIFLLLALFSVYISYNISSSYFPIIRTFFFLFFYHFGYIYRTKIEGNFKINCFVYFLIIILIQLIVLKIDGNISYVIVHMSFKTKYVFTPIIVSLTGILFWLKVSEILTPSLQNNRIINYIGNHTYDIMMHHLFWLFVANFIVYKLSSVFNLTGFSINTFKSTIYYCYTAGLPQSAILYDIFVIAMPLLIRYFYDKASNKFFINKNNK